MYVLDSRENSVFTQRIQFQSQKFRNKIRFAQVVDKALRQNHFYTPGESQSYYGMARVVRLSIQTCFSWSN